MKNWKSWPKTRSVSIATHRQRFPTDAFSSAVRSTCSVSKVQTHRPNNELLFFRECEPKECVLRQDLIALGGDLAGVAIAALPCELDAIADVLQAAGNR